MSIDLLHPLLLNIGFAVQNGNWNWKNVNSPFMRFYLVTDGYAEVELFDNILSLTAGHMYYIPAFATHGYICDSYFAHYYLHIYEENDEGIRALDGWRMPLEIDASDYDLVLIKRLFEINPHISLKDSNPAVYDNRSTLIQNVFKNKQQSFYQRLETRGIILQLFSRFLAHAERIIICRDERIESVLTYIHKHIYENISIESLSKEACISKDHFIRLFKKEMGLTPLQYINKKKIEKAELLLVTDNMPVKNIASILAFYDYSYFDRLFKKKLGMTPIEYRRLNQ